MGEELQQALNDELIPNHEWDKPIINLRGEWNLSDNLIIDTHGTGLPYEDVKGVPIGTTRKAHRHCGASFNVPENVNIVYYQHLDSNCAVFDIADCSLPGCYSGKNLKELCTDSLFDVFLDDQYLNTTFYTENTLETTDNSRWDLILEYIRIVDNLGYSSEDLKGLWIHARMGLKIKKDAVITKIIDGKKKEELAPNLLFTADKDFNDIYSCPIGHLSGAQRLKLTNIHNGKELIRLAPNLVGHHTLHGLCEYLDRYVTMQWYIHIFTCTPHIPWQLRAEVGKKGVNFSHPSSQMHAENNKQFDRVVDGREAYINSLDPYTALEVFGKMDKYGGMCEPGMFNKNAECLQGEGVPNHITGALKIGHT